MNNPEATPPFKDRFLKKFSQKKWDDFEKCITSLIRDGVNPSFDNNAKHTTIIQREDDKESYVALNGNNPEYSQAIGIMQGVCYYGLGMKCLGADNITGTPKNWLTTLCYETGKSEYRRRKINGLLK